MIVLNNTDRFARILDITVPWAHSYADMRPGKTDLERRENYRRAAVTQLRPIPSRIYWWAFRITVFKTGRPLDVDNIAKTIIDSFSDSQIARDRSSFTNLKLFPDDTFDHVQVLQVTGKPSTTSDSTRIEIFACVDDT